MKDDIIKFDVIDEHGPQTYRGTYDIAADELAANDDVAGPGNVSIDATVGPGHGTGEYVADGTSRVTIDLTCSRCVEPFPFANTSSFHVRFQPRPVVSSENEEVEITNKEELDVEFYSERSIPLRELAVEQLQLAVPMKPLCDESCRGLCPHCGANRSSESCSCESSIVDERWDALKGLRDQLAKKKDV